MSGEKKSWRDVYGIHPAADVLPMIPEDERRVMGEDIQKNGLRDPIAVWSPTPAESESAVILDGRNRLDAMEAVGMTTVELINHQWRLSVPVLELYGEKNLYAPDRTGIDPVTYVLSKNINRRHLSKAERAELVVRVINAPINIETWGHFAKMAKTVKRAENGKIQGSVKDPVKEKIVDTGAELGIGKRTMERAIADFKGPTHKNPRAPAPQFESEGFYHRPANDSDPLAEFDLKVVTSKILALLEEASEIEVRQVIAAIQRKFLRAKENGQAELTR